MKKQILLFNVFIFIILRLLAQSPPYSCDSLTVTNPGFEGAAMPHVPPTGWTQCSSTYTPDTQPGSWGVSLAAYSGSTYVGLVQQNTWQEGVDDTLSSPMHAGQEYNFTIAIATTNSTGGGIVPGCVELLVYGNNSGCDKLELLWSSGNVYDAAHINHWVLHSVTFTPTQDYTGIMFMVHDLGCSPQPYIMIDGMSPIFSVCEQAAFSSNPACPGYATQFVDHSVSPYGAITGWTWDFGDGSPLSNEQNPSHVYADTGTYDVTLITVSSPPYGDTIVAPVVISYPDYHAAFSADTVCVGSVTQFTDHSVSSNCEIKGWSWNFGDGSPGSNEQNPSHIFTSTGTYNVMLIITGDPPYSDTIITPLIVNAYPDVLTVTATPSVICAGQNSTLQASGAMSFTWQPGNMTGSSVVVHPSTATTYTVTGNNNGCMSSDFTITVQTKPRPTVSVPANMNACVNDVVPATSFQSTPSGATYTWTNSNAGIGLAASGSGDVPSFVTQNSGINTVFGVITVTPTLDGCVGTSSQYQVFVYPSPTVCPVSNDTICSNTIMNAISTCSNPSNANFSWTNTNTSIGLAASGSGLPPSFTATNTGNTPVSASVTITPTLNNCVGTPYTYIITVKPVPISEAGHDTVYSGIPVMLGDSSSGPGTFSWSPTSGLSDYNISRPLASPTETTYYTLTVSNNGCIATDAVLVYVPDTGVAISGKTQYAGKANAGSPYANPPYYNNVLYNINKVIVILKNYPDNIEIARDTSDAYGSYYFSNIGNGIYRITYDKYTADTMQFGNDINTIDVALLKYNVGADTTQDPSRNFSYKYKCAANVDNNSMVNAVDIARIKSKIGSPYLTGRNFPKGNWPSLDTLITVNGANLLVNLKTICYGDYNASSYRYRDSVTTWNSAKSLPQNIISIADDYIVTGNTGYFEVPLRISTKMKDFSALGLELNYPDQEYKLVNACMAKDQCKGAPVKINPSLDEIIADNNDLLVTDENGVIRVVYATTNHFDVETNDQLIVLGFRPVKEMRPGELDFSLSGTGVIGDQYGNENEGASLIMPKIFIQHSNGDAGFEFAGYPNPFSDVVDLSYSIPEAGTVKLRVYNSIGELVAEPVSASQAAGRHVLSFPAGKLPAGMYTFRLEFTGNIQSNCLILKMVH